MSIYKNIFGKPNTGIHSIRIFNIAIIDVLGTIIASYFISKKFNINFTKTLLWTFIFGIILHKLFCVDTTVSKLIF